MNEYKVKTYNHDAAKQKEYWDTAIGSQDVDGLKPSAYVLRIISTKHQWNTPHTNHKKHLNECYKRAAKSEKFYENLLFNGKHTLINEELIL